VRPARRVPGGRRAGTPAPDPGGRWIAALPAWGDRCVGVLLRSTLPALVEALRLINHKQIEIVVWTDQPDRVRAAALTPEMVVPATVTLREVPGPDGAFESLSSCHRQVLAEARGGDRVLLLTSDMVVSREVVATCEAQIASGKRVVCCAPPRALEDAHPPVGATGRDLLSWAWDHRHPMTRDCTWPDGRSYDLWRMYFEKGDEVAARVFLPHPLACVPAGRRMAFRPTIDVNLVNNFSLAETHMITRPEEGAVVEVSPADKDYLTTTTLRSRLAAGAGEPSCPAMIQCRVPHHRMFFQKKVVIRGDGGDCGDGDVVGRVLG
jgi:hypothetical protein